MLDPRRAEELKTIGGVTWDDDSKDDEQVEWRMTGDNSFAVDHTWETLVDSSDDESVSVNVFLSEEGGKWEEPRWGLEQGRLDQPPGSGIGIGSCSR
jgi:hypothetical protein